MMSGTVRAETTPVDVSGFGLGTLPGTMRAEMASVNVSGFGLGALPEEMEVEAPEAASIGVSGIVRDTQLPARYDPRGAGWITQVKNQGALGSCWSFASVAAMESSLIKGGLAQDSIDLSELHLIYFMYSRMADPFGRVGDDYNYVSADGSETATSNFSTIANAGSSINSVGWQVSDWVGPYPEKDDDYNSAVADASYRRDASEYGVSDYHLKQVKFVTFDEEADNQAAVKRMVLAHGGAAATFYCDQTTAAGNSSYFKTYEDGSYTYYNPNAKNYSINHAVEIVGWDDSFSKTNFKQQPEEDGAWLVKNSWGTDKGQNGYIWLSYYDLGNGASAVAYEFEPASMEERIYQYDGSDLNWGYFTVTTETDFFAVFTADCPEGQSEVIDSVGVGSIAGASFQISVITDPVFRQQRGRTKLSWSQELGVTQAGSDYAGYQIHRLSSPVTVNGGETFVIRVKAPANAVALSYSVAAEVAGYPGCVETVKEGQYYTGNASSASTTLTSYASSGYSFRIKAFSNPVAYTTASDLTLNTDVLRVGKGGSLPLRASVSPENAYPGVIWLSSDESVATVTADGLVTGKKAGTCVVSAKSADRAQTAVCKVTVVAEEGYIAGTSQSGDLFWYIDGDGKLAVWGNGDYEADYEVDGRACAPWIRYADRIKTAAVSVTGCTSLKDLFYQCQSLQGVSFADTGSADIVSMERMFYGCTGLQALDVSELVFPEGAKMDDWLAGCTSLSTLTVPASMPAGATFPDGEAWVDSVGALCQEIPASLEQAATYYRRRQVGLKNGTGIQAASEFLTYGQSLGELPLTGSPVFVDLKTQEEVAGTLAWKVPEYCPPAGSYEAEWLFSPADTAVYAPLQGKLAVTVKKAVPVVSAVPVAAQGVFDPERTLADRTLTGGLVSVDGIWSWKDGTLVPVVAGNAYTAVFTPEDEANYEEVTWEVAVRTDKAAEAPGKPASTMTVENVCEKVLDVPLQNGWEWTEACTDMPLSPEVGTVAIAVYRGAFAGNYETEQTEVTVIRKCAHGELAYVEGTEPTCEEAGRKGYYCCNACGRIFTDDQAEQEITDMEQLVMAASGHVLIRTAPVPAACEQDGNIAYYTCQVCGKYFSNAQGEQELEKDAWIMKATGHAPSEAVMENVIPAGCTEDGSYDAVVYCGSCHKELERTRNTTEKLGHLYGEWQVVIQPDGVNPGVRRRICGRNPEHIEEEEIQAAEPGEDTGAGVSGTESGMNGTKSGTNGSETDTNGTGMSGTENGTGGTQGGANEAETDVSGTENGTNGVKNGTNGTETDTDTNGTGMSGTENGTGGTQGGANEAESGVSGTESGTNGTKSGTNGTEKDTNGTGMSGTENDTGGTQGGANEAESGVSGTESGTNGTKSGTNGTETGTSGTQSGTNGTETGMSGIETGTNGTETGTSGNETGSTGSESGTGGTENSTDGERADSTEQPALPPVGSVVRDSGDPAARYVVSGDGKTVMYSGTDRKGSKAVIPSEIRTADGVMYPVTGIAAQALKNNQKLRKLTMGDQIVEIGTSAFQNDRNLTTVKTGTGLTVVGSKAFSGCKHLKRFTVTGARLKKIGAAAFRGNTQLALVDLSKSRIRSIGKKAFYGDSSLKTIRINANALKTVGKKAFQGISPDATITVYAKNRKTYEKAVKMLRAAGAKKAVFRYRKKK